MRIDVGGAAVYAYTGSRAFDPAQPTVVFVHGAAGDHSVWALQSRYFAHHGHNALAVDLPGHGRSGGGAHRSVESIADWIVALLDALAIERAVLAGHSLGSLAVLHAAATHGARVSRLALLGSVVPMPVSEVLLAAARDDCEEAYAMITSWSFSPRHLLGGNQAPGMWMAGGATRLMQRSSDGVLHADLAACSAYAGGLEAARAVAAPTLVVVGQRDLMAPPRSAQALIDVLPDARVVTVPECGHSMMIEAPDATLDALRDFVAR